MNNYRGDWLLFFRAETISCLYPWVLHRRKSHLRCVHNNRQLRIHQYHFLSCSTLYFLFHCDHCPALWENDKWTKLTQIANHIISIQEDRVQYVSKIHSRHWKGAGQEGFWRSQYFETFESQSIWRKGAVLSQLEWVASQVGYHISIASRKVPIPSTGFLSRTTIVTRRRILYLEGVFQCYVDIVSLSYCCSYTRCYHSVITIHNRLTPPEQKPGEKEGTRVDYEMAALHRSWASCTPRE